MSTEGELAPSLEFPTNSSFQNEHLVVLNSLPDAPAVDDDVRDSLLSWMGAIKGDLEAQLEENDVSIWDSVEDGRKAYTKVVALGSMTNLINNILEELR
jgi:hypothetical protein